MKVEFKELEIEARVVTEDNLEEVAEWIGGSLRGIKLPRSTWAISFYDSYKGESIANVGEVIVQFDVPNFEAVRDVFSMDTFRALFQEKAKDSAEVVEPTLQVSDLEIWKSRAVHLYQEVRRYWGLYGTSKKMLDTITERCDAETQESSIKEKILRDLGDQLRARGLVIQYCNCGSTRVLDVRDMGSWGSGWFVCSSCMELKMPGRWDSGDVFAGV